MPRLHSTKPTWKQHASPMQKETHLSKPSWEGIYLFKRNLKFHILWLPQSESFHKPPTAPETNQQKNTLVAPTKCWYQNIKFWPQKFQDAQSFLQQVERLYWVPKKSCHAVDHPLHLGKVNPTWYQNQHNLMPRYHYHCCCCWNHRCLKNSVEFCGFG